MSFFMSNDSFPDWSLHHVLIWSYLVLIGQIHSVKLRITFPSKSTDPRKSTDDVIRLYISNSFSLPFISSRHYVHEASHGGADESRRISPTRYMLPEQVQEEEESGLISYKYDDLSPAKYPIDPSKKDVGKGLVDYSLNQYSPAKYPIATNKKKRKATHNKESKKKKKAKTGKTVQFHSKVIIKTIHGKSDLTEIELSNEEEYDKRNSEIVVKRAHQQRPMTPKRMKIQATIQRENGNA